MWRKRHQRIPRKCSFKTQQNPCLWFLNIHSLQYHHDHSQLSFCGVSVIWVFKLKMGWALVQCGLYCCVSRCSGWAFFRILKDYGVVPEVLLSEAPRRAFGDLWKGLWYVSKGSIFVNFSHLGVDINTTQKGNGNWRGEEGGWGVKNNWLLFKFLWFTYSIVNFHHWC